MCAISGAFAIEISSRYFSLHACITYYMLHTTYYILHTTYYIGISSRVEPEIQLSVCTLSYLATHVQHSHRPRRQASTLHCTQDNIMLISANGGR